MLKLLILFLLVVAGLPVAWNMAGIGGVGIIGVLIYLVSKGMK